MPPALKGDTHNLNDEPPSDEEQEQEQQQSQEGNSNADHDLMGITTRGQLPRVSRRRRSEYAPTWQRAKAEPSTGRTGSKYRSTSRH